MTIDFQKRWPRLTTSAFVRQTRLNHWLMSRLVILESTVNPGVTRDDILPILEEDVVAGKSALGTLPLLSKDA